MASDSFAREPVKRRIRALARTAAFSFREQTSRIHNPVLWRLFYRLMETRAAIGLSAAGCRLAARAESLLKPEDAAERLSHLFLNGWPHHLGTPWINLNVLRFYWATRRRIDGFSSVESSSPRRGGSPLRVGVLANLESTLTFVRPFFEHVPENVELFAFDLTGPRGGPAYVAPLVSAYTGCDGSDPAAIASAIESARLDVLLADVYKANIYAILDGITTPCVVDIGSTVQFCFHSKVAFRYYGLEQADYLVRENRLFCATSRARFSDVPVYQRALLFETRGLEYPRPKRWQEREPVLVFHGKLYKASDAWLDTVFGLLEEDDDLQFVVMGRGTEAELERIRAAARRHGAEKQFHYEGEFRLKRNAEGEVDDPSWLRLADILRSARLAPDPWPLGGAYSRAEAYAAGVPLVHVAIRHDQEAWTRPQYAVTADHPALHVERTLAYTPARYGELCRKVLYEPDFADTVAAEQSTLVAQLADPQRFWHDVLACYETWLTDEYNGSFAASSERGL